MIVYEQKQLYICDPAKNKECPHRCCLALGRGDCCMTHNQAYSKARRKSSGRERGILRAARKAAAEATFTIAPVKK